jgi:hypothetical protein
MIYRKAKNAKVFYRIGPGEFEVCRVDLKASWYTITRCESKMVKSDALDDYLTVEITEAEFMTHYKIAKTGTDIEVTFI